MTAMRVLALLAGMLACASQSLGSGWEIPLSSVWARDMPGTQEVFELEPDYVDPSRVLDWYEKSKCLAILGELTKRGWASRDAGPILLIPGRGAAALEEVHRCVMTGVTPRPVPPSGEASLFLVSHHIPEGTAALRSVTVTPGEVVVDVTLWNHSAHDSSPRFALIPLPEGVFSQGGLRVNVNVHSSGFGNDLANRQIATRRKRSISSEVLLTKPDNSLNKRSISLGNILAHNMPWTNGVAIPPSADTPQYGDELLPISRRISEAADKASWLRPRKPVLFLVNGEGTEAFAEAAEAMEKGSPLERSVSSKDPVSIFFFARSGSTSIRLVSVNDMGDSVTVSYQETGRSTQNIAHDHFAAIPLGNRDPGDLRVVLQESPSLDDRGLAPNWRDRSGRTLETFTYSIESRRGIP